ncbi:hypothetical protein V5P93_006479 [Actinokineospora auranticolor]|uniref:Uncharacterized protein n=1 Tax=Actinokineospora auranticolor TaxID=155976 RepID=A0A2S6GXB6_9PSEU|nr:hypothetical protein [Actinokineospora auranticolor]PPK69882.1 hypothetical protein CLV40_103492 [Actinokineospora auranticolor]
MRTEEFEELVRDAVIEHADRAPDPEATVRRVLRVRRRRPVLVAASALVVVTLVVGALAWRAAGGARTSVDLAAPPGRGWAVSWGLAWLPSGFVEDNRSVTVDGRTVSRNWVSGEARLSLRVSVVDGTETDHVEPGSDDQVDVNGRPGLRDGDDTRAKVVWFHDATTRFEVLASHLERPRDVVVRVARSVVPQPQDPLVVAAEFGTLPAGAGPVALGVGRTSAGPSTFLTAVLPGDGFLDVELTPAKPDLDGERVLVLGVPGTYSKEKGTLTVPANGRWLEVYAEGEISLPDLVAVAETVRIAPADARWAE